MIANELVKKKSKFLIETEIEDLHSRLNDAELDIAEAKEKTNQ